MLLSIILLVHVVHVACDSNRWWCDVRSYLSIRGYFRQLSSALL